MDRSIRISARTVDDAITEALIQLGVTSDRLDYEVIERGSTGFLGIGMKQAVIEARVKVEKKETQAVENRSIHHKYSDKKDSLTQAVTPAFEGSKTAEKKPVEVTPNDTKPVVEKPAEQSKRTEINTKDEVFEVSQEAREAVEAFLTNTLKAMGMDVTLNSSIDKDGALYIDMVGENMGILIGKRGQTLDSIQYLANRVANKHQEDYIRVKLDIEDYRRRREETLTRLAKNLASKVKKSRRSVSLEPMNPYERRIIHSVLQSDHMVSTHSEGEEPYRKVVITMKRRNRY